MMRGSILRRKPLKKRETGMNWSGKSTEKGPLLHFYSRSLQRNKNTPLEVLSKTKPSKPSASANASDRVLVLDREENYRVKLTWKRWRRARRWRRRRPRCSTYLDNTSQDETRCHDQPPASQAKVLLCVWPRPVIYCCSAHMHCQSYKKRLQVF